MPKPSLITVTCPHCKHTNVYTMSKEVPIIVNCNNDACQMYFAITPSFSGGITYVWKLERVDNAN